MRDIMFVGLIGLVLWFSYFNPNKTPITPDTPSKPSVTVVDGVELIFESEVEKFPEAPQEAVQKLLEPLQGMFSQYPNDALELARVNQHFARNVRNNPKITNLSQLVKAEANAVAGVLKGSVPLQGNYDGRITPTQRAVRDYYLNPLMKDSEGNVTTTALDPTSREAVADYLDALSWKFSQEYLKEVSKPKMEK